MRKKQIRSTARTFIGCAAVLALAASPSSHAQTMAPAPASATPTIDQSLEIFSASSPRISPDGRWIAFVQSRTNWKENAFENDIWLVAASGGAPRQLTQSPKSSGDPRWSPDSRWIAFLSDRPSPLPEAKKDTEQIYLISPEGGEARQLTNVETGVSSFEWSPDGRRIAFTSTEPQPKAQKDREEKYGDIQVIQADYRMSHLWTIDVTSPDSEAIPEPHRLTEGNSFTVGGYSWSPDGARIAFSAARDPDLSDQDTSDIYVVTLADKSVKRIVERPGPDTNPVWSPDGKQIAYVTANGRAYFYYLNSLIATVPAEGGAPQILTQNFDEDPGLLDWGPDGIYFSAAQKTYSHLFRINTAGSRTIERITAPDHLIAGQFSFTKDFRHMAFMASTDDAYGEVNVSAVAPFAPKKLTSLGDQMKGFVLATRELVQWKSTDGNLIEGVLMKPANFDPKKKYPLLVVIHGGPTGVDRTNVSADRYYPVERFIAKGALVLRPNYRGSAGYGEAFRSLNVRNLGVGDYADVISGVDYLISKGWVDRDRVGAMGWSEGGYISAFITCASDRFRAVSVGAGISDWLTYYVNTDIHPFTRQYLHATPWDDPDIYRVTSPITYVNSAKTPTLIQQGGSDKRVPVPDSFELYQALEDHNVAVKMILYPGFGHPINKPKQQRAVMEENYSWFAHYIWGEPLDPLLTPNQP